METYNRVAEAIKELGLNPSKVETLSGIGNETIKRWEDADPKLSSVIKVAKTLNKSIDYLAGLSDMPNGQYTLELLPEEIEIISMIRNFGLTKNDMQHLKTMIEIFSQYRTEIADLRNEEL